MIKKWYGLARILPKCYLKLLHPFVCYSLSKDRCSAWKLPICCFDSIIAFDYRNCSHIAIYPSYIYSLLAMQNKNTFTSIFAYWIENKVKTIIISLSKHQSVSEWVSVFVCSLTPPKRRTPTSWNFEGWFPLGWRRF